MKLVYLFAAVLLLALNVLLMLPAPSGELLPKAEPSAMRRVLLVPLDGRPQCCDFVTKLGKIADLEIITPPPELLGDDREFARGYKLRRWLADNIAAADAAIISADMLIHGGLLPSRLNSGSTADISETLSLLREIHQQYPALPLYVFNIIPRITVADIPDADEYKDELLEYSALSEKIYTFGQAEDIAQRHYLEQKLPASLIINYHQLYAANAALNEKLLRLTQEGVITRLLVGQDDGEVFGLPNIVRTRFQQQAAALKLPTERAALARGADEIAQTLLCSVYQYFYGFNAPRVFVMYNDPSSAAKIMPYMPNPTGATITERIFLSGALPVQSAESADFILYVNIGQEKTAAQRFANAQEVKKLLQDGYPVALIDLSENFAAAETLLPLLLSGNAPVNRLISYAGWNTTSNSAGTALAQAILFTERQLNDSSEQSLLRLYQHNLDFLNARFMEDYFYLKQDIDRLNAYLTAQQLSSYRLPDDRSIAESKLTELFATSSQRLTLSRGWQEGVSFTAADKQITLRPASLTAAARLPWHRTFEIAVELTVNLSKTAENFSQ